MLILRRGNLSQLLFNVCLAKINHDCNNNKMKVMTHLVDYDVVVIGNSAKEPIAQLFEAVGVLNHEVIHLEGDFCLIQKKFWSIIKEFNEGQTNKTSATYTHRHLEIDRSLNQPTSLVHSISYVTSRSQKSQAIRVKNDTAYWAI